MQEEFEERFINVRLQVYEASMSLLRGGFITASSGNVSTRVPGTDLIAITPTAIRYTELKPEDIVIIDEYGAIIEGLHKPSSETPMHTLIYREFKDTNSVIHTHSPYAITFAALRENIPMVCIEGLGVGADKILVTEQFEIPGTERFAEEVLKTLKKQPGSKAILIASHGVLVLGGSLNEAVSLAESVEIEAQVYFQAKQLGFPTIISDARRQEMMRTYKNYQAEG